ncbi:hypothetical protein Tco_1043155 [Tanacetum coccineum]|uniref:Uncharacterized protein n=1 Tax=Tanacetum coccineum TaxID=301880 RepID=A0ABQ5GL87_9ASTR
MFGYGCCNILVKGKVVKANFYGIDSLVQMSRKSSKQKSHNPDDKHQSSRDIGNYGSQCTNDTVVEDVLRLPEGGFSVTKLEMPMRTRTGQGLIPL